MRLKLQLDHTYHTQANVVCSAGNSASAVALLQTQQSLEEVIEIQTGNPFLRSSQLTHRGDQDFFPIADRQLPITHYPLPPNGIESVTT